MEQCLTSVLQKTLVQLSMFQQGHKIWVYRSWKKRDNYLVNGGKGNTRDKWCWEDGMIQFHEGWKKRKEKRRKMMRGEMLGNPHEQAITMID